MGALSTAEGGHEVEIKLAVESGAGARSLLERRGFRVTGPRAFEANIVFDTPGAELRKSGRLLRLREIRGRFILTYKGPSLQGPHKSREELETEVADAAQFQALLERLGYEAMFRYEKYRTELAREGEAGQAVVDETPIGVFIELEGPGEWIDKTAQDLGFTADTYIVESYGTLYRKHCEARGETPAHMVFGR